MATNGRDAPTCPIGRVPAGEIEAVVIDQLRVVFRQPEIIIGTWKAARPHDADITEFEAREALVHFDPLWDKLFPAEQARIVQLLVERVDIGLGGLDVHPTPEWTYKLRWSEACDLLVVAQQIPGVRATGWRDGGKIPEAGEPVRIWSYA